MTAKPQSDEIDRQLAMRIIGVADRTFTDIGLEPCRLDGRAKYYDLDAVLLERDRRTIAAVSKETQSQTVTDDDGTEIDVTLERALKLRAERVAQEIRNAKELGELAPVDLLVSVLGDALARVNGHLGSTPINSCSFI